MSHSPSRTGMILHKGATFHAPSTPPAETTDPVFGVPSLPRRSLTNLMDVVEDAAQRRERIAALIGSFDRDFSANGLTGSRRLGSSLAQFSISADESRRVSMNGATSAMDMSGSNCSRLSALVAFRNDSASFGWRDRQRVKHHTSDSGIGSTVSDTIVVPEHDSNGQKPVKNLISEAPSSITRSRSLIPTPLGEHPYGISSDGLQLIEKRILQPLAQDHSLQDFHPLIQDIPRRIGLKEILCLRDLEKALVYLAPARAKTPDTYLLFCHTWIHCFHATVDHLNENDQHRPTDAPYTHGYFLDLVEQVRSYAREMAASRQSQAAGHPAEEMNHSPSERLVLEGGLSQTGRPAQLVRVKDGKSIPIGPEMPAKEAGGQVYKEGTFPSLMKRALSEQSDDDDQVLRSMARKRKLGPGEMVSAPPPQKCQDCQKEFKRPCDLTKHEKTHSRPWKCAEIGCKYHTYGWPTETERDRHVNDKHSVDPPMHKCKFPPCTYKTKRESNCKQHMEKAHGWTYVRAKGVGKKAGKKPSPSTSHTPQATTPDMENSGITPPMTRDPSQQSGQGNTASEHHFNEGIAGAGYAKDDAESLETSFFNDPQYGLNMFMSPHDMGTDSFGPSLQSSFNGSHGFHQNGFLQESNNTQLLTPNLSTGRRPSGPFLHSPDQDLSGMFSNSPLQPIASFSPAGQANIMLYTPHSIGGFTDDEGFEDFNPTRPAQDFPLYSHDPILSTPGGMFQELQDISSQTGYVNEQPSGSGESQLPAFFGDFVQLDSQ
ncbi:MAG: copper-binding transcription factor [Peltula sp. TS41687]|nr:MAG: copper-binding transcription factor [Peltula sp. TS41687]